ncbi:hypothetical protein ACS126_03405 [Sphingobacterium lactis]|uniref:hypothetical protein n=1 Tax=Sphingobacterium lactis TaxID=797291 RepID=UPI003EC80394
MRNLALLLGIILLVSCSKNDSVVHVEPENDLTGLLREDIKSETRKLSSFIDRYVKSSNMVKSYPNSAPPPVEEAVQEYIQEELSPAEALLVDTYIAEVSPHFIQFATANETLPLLSEAPTELAATTLIKDNFRQSTYLTNSVPTNDNTLKSVLNSLHGEINDEIENDLANAYLIDDEGLSDIQIETLYESNVASIKNKVSSKVTNFNNGLLINSRGLTSHQVNLVGITGMVALEAIDDVVLLENLEAVVSANLELEEVVPLAETKGLFKKIGKFFTKVVKTVAVVVTYVVVAAVTVYNAAVAATDSGYAAGSAAMKAGMGAGAMINFASTWKKTWNWVGWNDWSRW